ncbi:hypothetical protein Peur_003250 [Populus x canadensis]
MEDSPEILLSPLSPYTYLSTAHYQSTFGYIFWAKNEQMLTQWTVPCCCQLVPTKPGTCLLGTISFTVVHLGTLSSVLNKRAWCKRKIGWRSCVVAFRHARAMYAVRNTDEIESS